MSLVGPRPPRVKETEKYSKEQMEKFNVIPGITGLWQVSGRSLLPFREQVKLDLEYIKTRSIRLDMEILYKTIPTIISGKGAY
jgi:lipopolysaccharide/colanic/teichoic acid biosynthesis glycosyltransferase